MPRSKKSRKPKIKPWILDYIKAKLGWEGNTKWDGRICIGKIQYIESNTIIIISDSQYYIKCQLSDEILNGNQHKFFRPNILLNIQQSNIEINSSFKKLHLLINNFSFESFIPILNHKKQQKKPIDINSNKLVQNVIVIRRRKGIIFGMGDTLYIRGKYNEYCYAINTLNIIYYDIMYLIVAYKNGKGFVTKKEKKKIRNDFLILAKSNININNENYNDLVEYYELISDVHNIQFDETDLLNILSGKADEVIDTNSRYPKVKNKNVPNKIKKKKAVKKSKYVDVGNVSQSQSSMTNMNIVIDTSVFTQINNNEFGNWKPVDDTIDVDMCSNINSNNSQNEHETIGTWTVIDNETDEDVDILSNDVSLQVIHNK